MVWVATAILGGSVISSAAGIYGASKASSAQQSAAQQGIAAQQQMYNQTQKYLAPYRQTGQGASSLLASQLPSLEAPVVMNEATLQQTPGYQWNLQQGLKSVQNSAAARGLGESGAALKGASTFATGLADSTYQQQFQNAWQNKQNAFNMLLGGSQLGESAAAGTGAAATAAGQGIASSIGYAGNASAAGYNALGAAGNTVGNAATTYGLYYNNSPAGKLAAANAANAGGSGMPNVPIASAGAFSGGFA